MVVEETVEEEEVVEVAEDRFRGLPLTVRPDQALVIMEELGLALDQEEQVALLAHRGQGTEEEEEAQALADMVLLVLVVCQVHKDHPGPQGHREMQDLPGHLEYFWNVAQKAHLGGATPQLLGCWLGMRLEEGSPVQVWYTGLPGAEQTQMRAHWILYLQGIQDNYLGPGEVYHVMEKAPISWGPILVLENIISTMTLYTKVTEHSEALVNAWSSEGTHSREAKALTLDRLPAMLKALGYYPDCSRIPKQTHLAMGSEDRAEEPESGEEVGGMEDEVLKQIYSMLKERKRLPPPGGYPFPKNDHVVTKLVKLPPGPCHLCGSEKHWNWECPNYVIYLEAMRRNTSLAAVMEPSEEERMYQSAFSVLLNQTISNSKVDFSGMKGSFFEQAASETLVSGRKTTANVEERESTVFPAGWVSEASVTETPLAKMGTSHEKSEKLTGSGYSLQDNTTEELTRTVEKHRGVEMEEVKDEDVQERADKPKSVHGLIESVEETKKPVSEEEDVPKAKGWESLRRARESKKFSRMVEEFWLNDG
ncbi:hypothetical protein DFH07DRAFT_778345 [Mycena maculata]|uniref:Uncharacterized protein n=1 Tax=Mycena maculata TaxID=230809 RepID=A0AAD7IDT8_9AGAR|nr:hypothetical protein DFH07DRAFT_778345 [Mycena maculata]